MILKSINKNITTMSHSTTKVFLKQQQQKQINKKTGLTARNFGKIRVKMNENEC